MSEDLPTRMPPPIPAPPTTRVPRVFNIWGTIVYGIASATTFISIVAYGFGWNPPWFIVLPSLFYVATSSGIIALGRIEANRESRFFIQALRKRSAENKQRDMRRMN